MPRAIDMYGAARITHDPTQRVDTAIGKLPPFDVQQIIDGFLTALKDLTGIDLKGIRDFLESLFGAIDWSNLPNPGDVWGTVVTVFLNPLINIVQKLNELLGPIFGGIDLSNPLDPSAVWHTVVTAFMLPLNLLLGPNSPLNLANAFGRLSLPQFGGGVPLSFLTTAVPNLLEPFSPTSVPTADGWSFDAAADAAKVVADGTVKTLYLNSTVIKVEPDQPLNTLIKVKYSGVSSTAGQGIRYVLETFTTADGSGPATPVVLGTIPNPTGTISSPVPLGDPSWAIPAGVQSVRPTLVTDAFSAGTTYWLNTPLLEKPLQGVLAGGLPAALNNLGDWIESLVDQLLSAVGLSPVGSLLDKIFDLSDEIGDWLSNTESTAAGLSDLLGDLLHNPATVIGTLPQSIIDGLGAALASAGGDIADAIVQALGGSGTGHGAADVLAALMNIPTNVIDGLDDALADAGSGIRDAIVQALGGSGTGHSNADVLAALQQIPAHVVQSAIDGAATIDDAIQNAMNTIASAVGDITGSGGIGLSGLLATLTGLRNTVTAANEAVVDLQAQVVEASGSTSTQAVVRMANYANAGTPPSVFTKVSESGTGGIVTSGGKLVYTGGVGTEMYLYNVGPLQTNLFEVNLVMPNTTSHGWLGASGANFVYAIGRAKADGTAMVYAELAYDRVRILCLAGGVTTQLGIVSSDVPAGALIKFTGGTGVNSYLFTVTVNNSAVLTVNDSGHLSYLGSDARYCGLGMKQDSTYETGTVSIWSMLDGALSLASGSVLGYNNGVLTSKKIDTLTVAQYAAISTPDPNTLYVVY